MLDTSLSIDVVGKQYDPSTDAWIEVLIQDIETFTTVNPSQLKEIAQAVKNGIERNIATGQKYTGGSVAPLAFLTIQQKGFSRPLFQTGQLLGSVQLTQSGENTYEVFINSNRSEIASYLNFGTKRMPARPFFGISEAVLKQIEEILTQPLTK